MIHLLFHYRYVYEVEVHHETCTSHAPPGEMQLLAGEKLSLQAIVGLY